MTTKNLLKRTAYSLGILGNLRYQRFFESLERLSHIGMNIGVGAQPEDSGELGVLEYVKRKEGGNIVIFDVGASTGAYTRLIRGVFPDAEIYAFEPSSKSFAALSVLEGVRLNNIALSDERSASPLYADSFGSEIGSLYRRKADWTDFGAIEEVRTDSIDLFCRDSGIREIGLLKLDVEGNELRALMGAREMLKDIKYIQFEFGGCDIDSRVFFRDLYDLLKDDFRIYRIVRDGLFPIDSYDERQERFVYSNFLAERK